MIIDQQKAHDVALWWFYGQFQTTKAVFLPPIPLPSQQKGHGEDPFEPNNPALGFLKCPVLKDSAGGRARFISFFVSVRLLWRKLI